MGHVADNISRSRLIIKAGEIRVKESKIVLNIRGEEELITVRAMINE